MFRVSGQEELEAPAGGIHETLAGVQEKTAFLPDYGFKAHAEEPAATEPEEATPEAWPAVSAGTSVSGIVGGLITLALAGLVGIALRKPAAARA